MQVHFHADTTTRVDVRDEPADVPGGRWCYVELADWKGGIVRISLSGVVANDAALIAVSGELADAFALIRRGAMERLAGEVRAQLPEVVNA